MPRTILIVDDLMLNREILKGSLRKDYDILEAGSGKEALELMRLQHDDISAVLLDIMMPEMDGYEVLECIRSDETISGIPVIMITGSEEEHARVKCLTLGANDFVMKPYNPDIIKHCLRNNIALRETEATVHALQRDKLTGLFNRELFFEKAGQMVAEHEPGYYVMACFDIDKFKVINDQYGTKKGDEVLKYIAAVFRVGFEANGGICCRVSADDFAVLYPASFQVSRELAQIRFKAANVEGLASPVTFCIGRYTVTDTSMTPSAMYDRAMLAAQSVKGRYDVQIAKYEESMRRHLLSEQEIVNEMESALEKGQFEAWFQPQYNHSTDALIGSEALARWRHPERGLVSPGLFIPIFEQNGFVYELDKHIWEQVCSYLRTWIDEGRNPLPVSVNISRYDIFRSDLTDVIKGLVRKYKLPVELLRLEITESAFSKSSEQIICVVEDLIDAGFTVEIDDFGSGYSSLNTLKDVPAQVLKLDMKFLESSTNSLRGGNIVESIVRMAKWLNMSVIAEGVETLEQANFLRSIGCNYIQGYLYARPMPAEDYKALCAGFGKEERLLALETVENLDNNSFWDPSSMDTLIFNSFVGGACIFEYHCGNIELLRATEKYAQMLGSEGMTVEDALKLSWADHIDTETSNRVAEALEESIRTKKEVTRELVFLNIPNCPRETYLRSTMRVIASTGDRYLVYCTNENITAQRAAERKERQFAEEMRLIMTNMRGGVCAAAYLPDGDVRIIFANNQFYSIYGYTKEQFESELSSPLDAIHPDDRDKTLATVERMARERSSATYEYRCFRRDGSIVTVCCNNSVTSFAGISDTVLLSVTTDVTELVQAQQKEKAAAQQLQTVMDNVGQGITASVVQNGKVRYIFSNDKYFELLGYTRAQFEKEVKDPFLTISEEDRDWVAEASEDVTRTQKARVIDYRAKRRDGSKPWFRTTIAAGSFAGVKEPVQLSIFRDITEEKQAEIEFRSTSERLEALVNSILGGIATYEGVESDLSSLRLVYFSDGLCRMLGYTREEYTEMARTNPTGLVLAEDKHKIEEQMALLFKDGSPADCVYRVRTKDGNCKWINLKAVSSERKNGRLTANAVFFDVTKQQETLDRLRVSEEENRLAIKHSKTVVCRYDVEKMTLSVSPSVNPIFKASSVINDVPYGEIKRGNVSSEFTNTYKAFYESIIRGEKEGEMVYQRKSLSGWRWLEAHFSTIFSDDGKPISAVVSFFDITERLEKEAAYNKWQRSLEEKDPKSYTLFRCNLSKDVTHDTTQGELLHVSFDKNKTTFNERTEEYVEQCVYDEDKRRYTAFMNSDVMLANFYRGKRADSIEYREKQPDGSVRWRKLSIELLEYPNSTDVEAYLMYEDITEEKEKEIKTREMADADPLTKALNRKAFAEQFAMAMGASKPDRIHALLLLDVDGFKVVNDVFGHVTGDETLIEIANALRTVQRRGDLIARPGGDEFLLFLNDVPNDAFVANTAARLCEMTRKAFSLDVQISSSVGIVMLPRDGVELEELYKKLDSALYYVKGFGKDNYAFYRNNMEDWRLAWEEETEDGEQKKEHKRRMLIVDDNDMDFELLSGIFADEFLVEKAKNGNAALTCLRYFGSAISVVLLDLMMPGMDGFSVLDKMMGDAELRSIPVVVVSGDEKHETCLKAINCGATDFVTKPVDAEMLRIRVKAALSKSDNELMRAQSSYRLLQSDEMLRYKTVLDRTGVVVVEQDWVNGKFTYDPSISKHIFGSFDKRGLWHILLADMVTDAHTVQVMQRFIHDLANDRSRNEGSMTVQLKAPSGARHDFLMNVYKITNEFGLADKLIITFRDMELNKLQ